MGWQPLLQHSPARRHWQPSDIYWAPVTGPAHFTQSMSGYAKVRLTSRSALRHIIGPQGLLLFIHLINLAPLASVCRQKAEQGREQGRERGGLPLAHWPPLLLLQELVWTGSSSGPKSVANSSLLSNTLGLST